MNIFEEVTSAVDIREAAELYGMKIRYKKAVCPFHSENTPSLAFYKDHFHCFGCGKHGNVIDLTEQLLGLTPLESTKRLAADFGIMLHDDTSYCRERRSAPSPPVPRISESDIERSAYKLISDYCRYLEGNLIRFSPTSVDSEPDSRYTEAVNDLERFRYYKEIFFTESFDDRMDFINSNLSMLDSLAKKLDDFQTA